MTTTPTPLVCSQCNSQNAPNYFRVTKIVNANGVETPLTLACSLPCLLKWIYAFSAMQGARLAFKAKSAWDQLTGMFKGR